MENVITVLKGILAFKLKRSPDSSPLRYKTKYWSRGNVQTKRINYFEIYVPGLRKIIVRLILVTILSNDWYTEQIDYTKIFAQA